MSYPLVTASTSSQSENDFAPTFKKARFAWQIKGKGRNLLKRSVGIASLSSCSVLDKKRWTAAVSEGCGCCVEEIESNSEEAEEQNIHSKCMGKDKGWAVRSTAVPSFVRADTNLHSISPAHMVAQCLEQLLSTLNRTHYNLRKWQTKQVANGIIDNAVNKVLEDIGFTSFSVETSENFNPRNIEAEGVSEAIRQRGLARNSCHHNPLTCKHHARSIHELPPVSALLKSNKCTLHNLDPCCQGATCTCWHYCRMNVNSDIGGLLDPQSCCVCCIKHQMVDKLTYVGGSDDHESLLNAAVTFAIGEKGLHLFTDIHETTYW